MPVLSQPAVTWCALIPCTADKLPRRQEVSQAWLSGGNKRRQGFVEVPVVFATRACSREGSSALCVKSDRIQDVDALCVGGAETRPSGNRRTTPGDRCSSVRAVPAYASRFAFY